MTSTIISYYPIIMDIEIGEIMPIFHLGGGAVYWPLMTQENPWGMTHSEACCNII